MKNSLTLLALSSAIAVTLGTMSLDKLFGAEMHTHEI